MEFLRLLTENEIAEQTVKPFIHQAVELLPADVDCCQCMLDHRSHLHFRHIVLYRLIHIWIVGLLRLECSPYRLQFRSQAGN